MVATASFSALCLGLPPSPENAPATINIDRTCALFALEVAGNRVAITSECSRRRVEEEPGDEIPRLHRILNLPFTPRANRVSTTSISSNDLFISTNSSASSTSEDDKENEAPRLTEAASTTLSQNRMKQTSTLQPPVSSFQANHASGVKQSSLPIGNKNWGLTLNRKPSFTTGMPHATFLSKERRLPLRDLVPSALSAKQKVIKRPAPKPRVPQFTNPFSGNVPIPVPAASYTFSNASANSNDVANRTASWRRGNPIPSPIPFHSSDMGLASFVAVTYPDEIVELHRRRIYPSSTEPESNWCVGETIEYVRRRDLYPYDVVKPVVKTSTIEVGSPRPVRVNRYHDTQKWLQRLARELAAD
ncbi:hypothetical protein E1B28_003558 [Marasmius oreades]|uniref:Uncharacterized protein n=1 Tax=Marasmius oreades TaxID=181124 RepID=A0A9P7RM71_9AGAR|nr:uncharacterized protein E1B28_003558 [Marasmius oreades]KAG7086037.1 hypothetical protein E1B28_003558 [Marasmius oreades]